MTRDIKRMITMNDIEIPDRRRRLPGGRSRGLRRNDGRHQDGATSPRREEVEGGRRTERETISKAGADRDHPQGEEAQDHRRSARRLREGDEALPGRQEGRRHLALASAPASSDAFKRVADDNPGLVEARFNQGAVLYECGREDEAARIWDGLKYGPAITNLGYIAWKNNETGPRRVAVQERDQGRSAPQRRGAQQHRADPARQGAQGREQPRRRRATSARR